ncbi:MAG: hypothetical protein ACE37L_04200 [Allomuricauda sp.]
MYENLVQWGVKNQEPRIRREKMMENRLDVLGSWKSEVGSPESEVAS